MRAAFALLLLAFSLLLPGCLGSGDAAPPEENTSVAAAPAEPPPAPPAPPEEWIAPLPAAPKKNISANASAPAQEYVNYCYTTFWKGTLQGSGHNYASYDRCGDYNYTMGIDVQFTMPYDLAAYLAGKDFNFNDCPSLPKGAANGSRDLSISGNFRSERNITSEVSKMEGRLPDSQTNSQGALYVSQPAGLMLATYARNETQGKTGNYTHMVVARCTWGGHVQIEGYDKALLFGAEAGNFSYSKDLKAVSGMWEMNGTLAGTYSLVRTN